MRQLVQASGFIHSGISIQGRLRQTRKGLIIVRWVLRLCNRDGEKGNSIWKKEMSNDKDGLVIKEDVKLRWRTELYFYWGFKG